MALLSRRRIAALPRCRFRTLAAVPVLAVLVSAASPAAGATAAEVCRFEGTTSHAGRVAVRTTVTPATDGRTVVDVALSLRASVWWVFDVQYLTEEVSTWRDGVLLGVALNTRTLDDGRVMRQQWDVFTQGDAGLQGWRVQARTLAEFRHKHPGFVQHWDPASFGGTWLRDYAAAGPERRPDLDLPRAAMAPGQWPRLRTPLAMAFYWARWLPPGGQVVPVFLPGFKRDARADLAVAPAAAPPTGAWQFSRVRLHHPALGAGAPSEADAWISPDRHLLALAFDVHARQGAARGVVRALGCQGVPFTPG